MGVEWPYKRPQPTWSDTVDPSKTLVLADIHEPYAHGRVLDEALKHKDAHTVLVAGDIGDYYSKSRFRKDRQQSFKEELAAVFYRLEWLATHWRRVIVMLGNHDNRPEKYLLGRVDNEVDLLVLTELNTLRMLASYFDNVEVVRSQLSPDIEISHVFQYGDVVLTHAEITRAQETATLERIETQLHRWQDRLRLKPWRVVMQAHNHGAMKLTKGDQLWFMLPCAMDPLSVGASYIWNARMWGTPPAAGITLLYQDSRGVTDFNATNFVLVK